MARKELRVRAFGAQRALGEVEGAYLGDALAIVQWMLRAVNDRKRGNRATAKRKRRDSTSHIESERETTAKMSVLEALEDPRGTEFPIKRPRISLERARAAEQALRASDACPYASFDEVLAALQGWYAEAQREFSASKHYDAARAAKYTEHNAVPQQRLTSRCLDLIEKTENPRAEVVLDIACGSGICVAAVRKARPQAFVIGFDSAPAMLALVPDDYADTIQADMSQGLPFRDASFDWSLSVSAIHFLRETDTRRRFFRALADCSKGTEAQAVAQFYPANEEAAKGMRDAAVVNGWSHAVLVKDQSHHRASVRTFLQVRRQGPSALSEKHQHVCALYENESACFLQAAHAAAADEDHLAWVRDEHARFARDAMRKSRHDYKSLDAENENGQTRCLGHRLMDRFGGQVPDLDTVKVGLEENVLVELHA
ncbi:18S rRNA guanine1575-N7-methyltransferase [Hondaea fermentalgiana]|uniref:18S rRNA guanine1575-N7-methyltransferase n=1 Tax=Hondaea fermentalgiana TaxID=2315210 RepID=A0A2R5GC59_9STRA|nr:18S rRNA guanine1575-N7-methyltransferase [Hondaea fermentalgiana]|eukprot:GBG25334.1 18S rRNA guanine1575-N7-methyltransferase [Hondaea fermentalgiana]